MFLLVTSGVALDKARNVNCSWLIAWPSFFWSSDLPETYFYKQSWMPFSKWRAGEHMTARTAHKLFLPSN